MIYLKENKINKFDSNKIYLGDKLIYQAVKGEEKPITQPSYLKKGFDYNSFTENGIVDAFNNEIITQYESYVYSSNDFVKNDENKSVEITFTENNLHSTGNNNNYIFDEFKSILFKCENMANASQFTFFNGLDDNEKTLDITISFNTKSIIYGEDVFLFHTLSEEQRNSIVYIYVDFNLTDSQSTIKFLDSNFETVFEETTDSILLNNWRNSESPIDFRGGVGKKINFSYLLYCDKFLSTDEIKEIDNYMMNRY